MKTESKDTETDYYIFIRMWSNDDEDDDEPFYPYYKFKDGSVEWGLSRYFDEANLFKSADIAIRIVQNVQFYKERLQRGWGYRVIRVSEECLMTNIVYEEEEEGLPTDGSSSKIQT